MGICSTEHTSRIGGLELNCNKHLTVELMIDHEGTQFCPKCDWEYAKYYYLKPHGDLSDLDEVVYKKLGEEWRHNV